MSFARGHLVMGLGGSPHNRPTITGRYQHTARAALVSRFQDRFHVSCRDKISGYQAISRFEPRDDLIQVWRLGGDASLTATIRVIG